MPPNPLTSVAVKALAVFAETIAASAILALPSWDVTTRRASVVVVIDPMVSGLKDFIH